MKLFHWEEGRQGTGYKKLALWQSSKLSCDGYLIDYPPHASIPTHTDPVKNKKHYRLNILLKGEDKFNGQTIFSTKRIKLFRPDIMPHSVEEVSVRRIILSIGWAVK
jgi:hypothetical protein